MIRRIISLTVHTGNLKISILFLTVSKGSKNGGFFSQTPSLPSDFLK